ncbi:MAG: ABC-F family ATP-binding cassette domain-containing protein, partial [Bdellovibrionales bacterium]|nr:ABC-F family ATP-binding cassette domain-containing protein [Bdellovibrionales bacterium]
AQREALIALESMKLEDPTATAQSLSGGQRKRLQLAAGLITQPDLLLIDEPTNHLDIRSILLLEELLVEASFAWAMVSHDRWLLENAATQIAEIGREYPDGVFVCDGSYSEYLRRRESYLESARKSEESLANQVRREQEWLRRGPKARTTKAKGRIDRAYAMMDSLSLVRSRRQQRNTDINFEASGRKTKELAEFKSVSKSYGAKAVLENLNYKIVSKQALGLLGVNATGKTTLLRLLAGEIQPDSGEIKRATQLNIGYFKQVDDSVDQSKSLKSLLAPDGDSVVYQGRSIHVATWAKKFGFEFGQLQQAYRTLSGGEKARVRLAYVMLQAPDILILDEPTNDLDIQTLESLEQALEEFNGSLVLVTHDRFMVNRLCTNYLGLLGDGRYAEYADYAQWEREAFVEEKSSDQSKGRTSEQESSNVERLTLSYEERKEYGKIEKQIEKAEAKVTELEKSMTDADVQADSAQLSRLWEEVNTAKAEVERLYARWQELAERA